MKRSATDRLFDALQRSDASAARRAIAAGADVNARARYGCTPLRCADSAELCRMLLAAGADLFVRDNAGNTLLHGTDARLGCWPLFLSAGLDVNARNKWGQTPLHRAECAESVKLLMQYGADPTLRNNDGETPAEYWLEEENASFLADELPQMLKCVHAGSE